jgi:hypothetical protein
MNLQSPQSDSTPWTLTIHEGVKTEVCHICGSSFFDKVGLSIHMNGVHVEGMAIRVVEFSNGVYKIRKIFA